MEGKEKEEKGGLTAPLNHMMIFLEMIIMISGGVLLGIVLYFVNMSPQMASIIIISFLGFWSLYISRKYGDAIRKKFERD